MFEVMVVMSTGLFVVGEPTNEEAMASAHTWLVDKGWNESEADNALANREPQEAWYTESAGFVYPEYDGAIHGSIIQVNDNYLLGPQ